MAQVLSPETAARLAEHTNNAVTTAAEKLGDAAAAVSNVAAQAPHTAKDVVDKAIAAVPPGLLDKLGDGMFAMFDKAGEVLKQYGPEAVHLALWYVRFEGAVLIVKGFALLGVASLFAYIIRRIWFPVMRKSTAKDAAPSALEVKHKSLVQTWENAIVNKREFGGAGKVFCGALTIGLTIAIIILSVEGFNHAFNAWNWVKVAVPEVGIVHDVYTGMVKVPHQ